MSKKIERKIFNSAVAVFSTSWFCPWHADFASCRAEALVSCTLGMRGVPARLGSKRWRVWYPLQTRFFTSFQPFESTFFIFYSKRRGFFDKIYGYLICELLFSQKFPVFQHNWNKLVHLEIFRKLGKFYPIFQKESKKFIYLLKSLTTNVENDFFGFLEANFFDPLFSSTFLQNFFCWNFELFLLCQKILNFLDVATHFFPIIPVLFFYPRSQRKTIYL